LSRVRIVDQSTLNPETLLDDLRVPVSELLKATGATRLLVVLDYFQLLPVPPGPWPEGPDRCRVDLLEAVQRLGKTFRSPTGATIVAISEVRKQSTKGTELEKQDLLGSTRLNYVANSILLLQTPKHRPNHGDDEPRILKVDKARGGATCPVEIPMVFRHNTVPKN
jgi:hypothetical protein